jgi:hypothetical protein
LLYFILFFKSLKDGEAWREILKDKRQVKNYPEKFKSAYQDKDPKTSDQDWISAMASKRTRFRGQVKTFGDLVVEAIGWVSN